MTPKYESIDCIYKVVWFIQMVLLLTKGTLTGKYHVKALEILRSMSNVEKSSDGDVIPMKLVKSIKYFTMI